MLVISNVREKVEIISPDLTIVKLRKAKVIAENK